jgi:hypothetical protein
MSVIYPENWIKIRNKLHERFHYKNMTIWFEDLGTVSLTSDRAFNLYAERFLVILAKIL